MIAASATSEPARPAPLTVCAARGRGATDRSWRASSKPVSSDTGMRTAVAPNPPPSPSARPTSAGLTAAPRLPPTAKSDIARPRLAASVWADSAAAGGWKAAEPTAASTSKPISHP